MQPSPGPLEMAWLPVVPDWDARASALGKASGPDGWKEAVALANARIGFGETLRLVRALKRRYGTTIPEGLSTRPVRVAVMGSATVEHLFPGIQVGAVRHGIWAEVRGVDYGQYLQALLDPGSSLHQYKPDVILFAFEASHLFQGDAAAPDASAADAAVGQAFGQMRDLWNKAQADFGCTIIQQTVLPVALPLMGSNEHRAPNSPMRLIRGLNERLRAETPEGAVDLLDIDERISSDGLAAWHDPVMWHRAKQEISPLAGHLYGELVARILAARQGISAKCLVLDLDNTLWSGVIGDDGLDGIKLGQGSPLGEAHLAIQRYARDLGRRGIILAVCSKNDESVALGPFEKHPDMLLRRGDIACFVANWSDKAGNIRHIAKTLNIGLDAMVLLDDNPFERNLVRTELPMVAVPELPDEPALYPHRLAAAGYFEAVALTADDAERNKQYQANAERESLRASTTDLEGYLRGLQMQLLWAPFDRLGLLRIVQLINKTNQFNLTTRRYTEPEVIKVMENPQAFTLQLRLTDRFGDNGIIAIVIGVVDADGVAMIDTWLMSCRVLGRGVEQATLALVVQEAKRVGATELHGEYRPTEKNSMVREHYGTLGFRKMETLTDGITRWSLDIRDFSPTQTQMVVERAGTAS